MSMKHTNVIGTTSVNKFGEVAKIIDYRKYEDFDIEYLETKEIKNYTRGLNRFLKGSFINSKSETELRKKELIGIKKTQKDGSVATIIDYIDSKHITVQFDNGIIKKTRKHLFDSGMLNSKEIKHSQDVSRFIGTSRKMNNGYVAKVIDTAINSDGKTILVIQFEGTDITKKCQPHSFEKGLVSLDNETRKYKKEKMIGKEFVSTCGLKYKVLYCNNASECGIEFEDGIQTVTRRELILKNQATHPYLKSRMFEKYNYKDLTCELKFKFNNSCYYLCNCKKCNMEMILNSQEIINHNC